MGLRSLIDFALARAATAAERPAYRFLTDGEKEEATLTWGELDLAARRIAAALQRESRAGERALLLYPPGLDFVTAFLGCLYAGVVAVPVAPPRARRPDDRLGAILRHAEPALALTASPLRAQLAAAAKLIRELEELPQLETDGPDLPAADEWRHVSPAGKDLAFLQYTSGSTSTPKGVRVTHANLLDNERLIQEAFRQSEESVIVGWLPLYHDMGLIGNVLQPLYAGARCILMSPAAFLQKPARWLQAISRFRATTSGGPNFAYDLCARKVSAEQREGLDLSCWSLAFSGAEPVRAETLERFAAAFAPCGFLRTALFPCYGLAEATLFVSGSLCKSGPRSETFAAAALESGEAALAAGAGRTLVSCGSPASGQRIEVVDPETCAVCPPGRIGEVWVSGPSVADGYWGQPEESEAVFGARLASSPLHFLRTGDLGFLHDGELFLTGRLKDLIIVRGRNLYPQDIELTAERSHPALRPGCGAAFSVDRDGEERLIVVCEVERHAGSPAAVADALRAAVAEEHDAAVAEAVLLRTGTVPKTSSGKIRRGECRARYLAGTLEALYRTSGDLPAGGSGLPRGLSRGELLARAPAERAAALDAWLCGEIARRAGAGPERIAPGSNLASAGLDSLAAIELETRLATEFDLRLSGGALLDLSVAGLRDRILDRLAETTAGAGGNALLLQPTVAARTEATAPPPLSFAQERYWFLDRLEPGSPAYNILLCLRLAGGLRPQVLEEALREVVRRHAVLRTAFEQSGSGPVQRVLPKPVASLPVLDLAALPEETREAAARRLAVAEKARAFDLTAGRLLRPLLLRLADREHILLVATHHIAFDGSHEVFVRELAAAYLTLLGQGAALPAPPVDYGDLARWERSWMTGRVLEAHLAYWRGRLQGEIPVLELPVDRRAPAVRRSRGAGFGAELPAELAAELWALARARGCTLYMVLLAGFQVLLHRYTEQRSIWVGSPAAVRPPETERVIGCFINTLVMRADLVGDLPVTELLEQVRDSALGAYRYRYLPFDVLVRELRPERGLPRSPLFQTMLGLTRLDRAGIALPGLAVSFTEVESRTARFDLLFALWQGSGDELGGMIEYDRDLFDRSTIARLLEHYRTLLAGIARRHEDPVADLPLLGEGERHQMAVGWNDTAQPYDRDLCIHELVAAQAARRPQAVAVATDRESLTYGELERRANRLAHWLIAHGAGPDTCAGIHLERSTDTVVALLGVLKAGAAYVPLELSSPQARLRRIVEALGMRHLVTQASRAGTAAALGIEHEVWVDAASSPDGAADGPPPRRSPPRYPAYVIFTSGSTGTPKGVVVCHRPVVNLIDWATGAFGMSGEDRGLFVTSLGFDLSVFDVFGVLAAGGSVRVALDREVEDPRSLLEILYRESITFWNSAPATLQQLVPFFAPEPRESRLRLVFLSGDWIPVALPDAVRAAFPGAAVVSLGGATEATVWSNVHPIGRVEPEWTSIPYGRPIQNARYHVLDRHLRPCPIGVAGDLYIGGECLAEGYAREPALTAAAFLPDALGGEAGGRLYRTGDRARLWADGVIEFLGRRDHQVKVRGFRIELGEIESALAEHSGVREAVVAAREGPGGKRLVAYVVPRCEPWPGAEELRRHAAVRLPDYMVPAAFVSLPALPLTANGKVDRGALPAPDKGRPEVRLGSGAPANPIQEALATVWEAVLGRGGIAPEDDFFDLGGDSLLATHLVSRLREAFGVELPVRKVFEASGLASLAEELARALRQGPGDVVPRLEHVPHGGRAPASFAQERLWFLDQLHPGDSSYNIPAAFRLAGRLDVATLAAVAGEVVRRQESLRTTFKATDRGVVQVIAPSRPPALPVVDLSSLDASRRETVMHRLAQAEAERPFDLARAPLLRLTLLRLAEQEHAALVTLHHIISDAWSLAIFTREIAALYAAFAANLPSPLPELPVQYADYARWQRQWLQGEVLERQLAYWRKQLAGAPAALELPTDRPRPPVLTYRGAASPIDLGSDLSDALATLGRRHGATLFMVLLAAFEALLLRITGCEDLVVGVPIANRTRAEIEGLLGFFVNSLALRADLSGDPGFTGLLARVREAALGAYVHQDLPFEKLVDDLQPGRDLSRSPIFQVLFQLQRIPLSFPDLPDLTLTPLRLDEWAAKLDLVVSLEAAGGRVKGVWDYNTDLFEAATVARLQRWYLAALAAVARAPERRISEAPLLGPAELHQLLAEWNDPQAAFPAARPLHRRFEEQAARRLQAPAVICDLDQISYGELNERANRLARRLLALGVAPGDRVGLCLDRSLDLVVGLLGILKTGAAYLPLDPAYPAERLAFLLADGGARLVVTTEPFLERLAGLGSASGDGCMGSAVCLDRDAAALAAESGGDLAPDEVPDLAAAPAYVIYTSGSTGRPKGVEVSHVHVSRLFAATEAWFGFSERDVWTLFHSFSFDFSVWEIWGALLYGGRLVVVPHATSRSPVAFLHLVRSERVTVLSQTPSAFRQLLAAAEAVGLAALAHLRFVVLGGEALELASLAPWFDGFGEDPAAPRLVNMYGITETTVHVTCRPVRGADLRRTASVIGVPIPDLQVHLADARGNLVPVGVAGEMMVGGAGVTRGYVGRPELTVERFVPDPWSGAPGARLYRSGDLARRRPNGELEYLGRIDQQVKLHGFRIELGEIEAALAGQVGVREAAVALRGDRLVAYVVPSGAPGAATTASELRRSLAARLPDHMVPAAFVTLSALPLTAHGKVDRRALPEPGEERPKLDRPFAEPRDDLGRFLARSWREVLGLDRVGVHDNFFELGGSSVKAAILANRLQEELGSIVFVTLFFDAPTIAELAVYLRSRYPEEIRRLDGGAAGEPAPSPVRPASQVDAAKLEQMQRLVRPLGPMAASLLPKNPPAVFILSPPRSGSTLLRVMLAGHPRLFSPPELELLSFETLGARQAAFQGRDNYWLEGLIRAVMELRGCDADEAKAVLAELEKQDLSIREAYRLLQGWIGDRMLIDKTSTYAFDPQVLARAEAIFAEPYYIHLIRHPCGMIRSFEEARMGEIFFRGAHSFSARELAELIWTLSHRNILDVLAGVPPHRRLAVRFEDLVREPRETLRSICDLLGLEFDPAMVRPYEDRAGRMTDGIYQHQGSRMLGDVKFHQHSGIDPSVAQRWRSATPENSLGDVTWELAESLGYRREGGAGLTAIERVPRAGTALPLSFAQERLWFLDRLQPGSFTYNTPAAVRALGPLDIPILAASLREIARRHESLRTTFIFADQRPGQRIDPAVRLELPVIDLGAIPPAVGEEEALRLAQEEAESPFDLGAGPLLRACLSRLAAGEHVLCLTLHHIVSDGWSMGVLIRELATLYGAFSRGEPSPLPELPVQYADYAAWQRRWLEGGVLAQQISYWKRRLAGLPSLQLPTDRPRPAVQSHRGETRRLDLPPVLRADLEALAQREGASLFMALLAGFVALLARYGGQADLAVGSPLANRNRAEIEGLIGFFVNTQVLRVDLSGDPTLRELLARARETALGAFAHPDVPFESLVDELQPERDLSYSPLFQVMLALQNTSPQELALPGIELERLEMRTRTAKFDLTVLVEERAGGLPVAFEYASDLFDGSTIDRLAGHFRAVLAGAAADPERHVSELVLLSAAEAQQLLREWNDTALAAERETACLHELLELQAERTPDALAVIGRGECLTYRELDRRANRLAHRLLRLGIGPESRIGLCPDRLSPDLVVAQLGILKAGGAWVPLDPAYPRERLAFTLADARATLVLTAERWLPVLPDLGVPVLCLDRDRVLYAVESEARSRRAAGPGHLAYVIYTSGSTGHPKGVAIEHRSAAALVLWAVGAFAPGELAGVLASTSICFDLSVFEIFVPLAAGGAVVLAENALQLPELPDGGRVTLVNTVPSAMAELVRGGGLPLSLRTANLAGEPLLAPLVRAIFEGSRAERVLNLYGPSEDTTYSTWAQVERGDPTPPIGRPVAGSRAYVVDRGLRPQPPGVVGELLLAGAGLARGYLDRPELTAERFLPDPFGRRGERVYRTGDLARYRADGLLEFLGRVDHQVKLRGFRIELGEIEAALATHPAVREAVAVVREETPGTRGLVAYIVPAREPGPAPAELRSHLAARLPAFFLPGDFVLLPALPRTPNGKVDRGALPAPLGQASAAVLRASSRSATEEILAGIWCEVLGVPAAASDDGFFELGGHSLLAARVVTRVREVLGADLPLRSIFQSPTLGGLAAEIERLAGTSRGLQRPPLERSPGGTVGEEGGLPLALVQERFWFLEQLMPGSPMHHITRLMRLTGSLDVPALAWSLGQIARRHAALRSGFRFQAGRPVQVVDPSAEAGLLTVDLGGLPPATREMELQAAAGQARSRFDLARPPLLRALLLALEPGHSMLVLDLHHLIADGISLEVLVRELAALYGSAVRGEPSRLPDLPVQYGDFVRWQRQWLQGEVVESQLAFWRRQLASAPPLLDLPTDRPRPRLLTYRGACHILALPREQAQDFASFSRREGVSLFMSCLAAFQILLHRCSGQSEVVVGAPVANRPHRALEGLIGLFTNTVSLRTSLGGNPTVRELLARVRETCLDAEAHQDLPLTWIIEDLQPERDASYHPIFQVLLGVRHGQSVPIELPGLHLEAVELEWGEARADLNLFWNYDGAVLQGMLEYNADLFDRPTIVQLCDQLTALLSALPRDPLARIADLGLQETAWEEDAISAFADNL